MEERLNLGIAGRKKDQTRTEVTRNTFLEKSYELFSTRTIESVTMSEIAKASGYKDMTLYRYFQSKPILVVAVAAWKWMQVREENRNRVPNMNLSKMTAAEVFGFYLDSFLALYRNHRDLLRFNQFFNIYIQSEDIDRDVMKPYEEIIRDLRTAFHLIYIKAEQDHTIRTDEPEEMVFSKTLHLMLAAVTRYAVGLVYIPENGFSDIEELQYQRNLLLEYYKQ
ncbi:transcriptional regulator [Lachnospiraceae bacterium JC7]|nr:transcriptional regulator [Lachnospiraceae bacterium JC7]